LKYARSWYGFYRVVGQKGRKEAKRTRKIIAKKGGALSSKLVLPTKLPQLYLYATFWGEILETLLSHGGKREPFGRRVSK
jgi:hypothetical protein